ncbi:MAG: class I SAM-dependent methyltransferase [Holophagales bacterium]|nr:class I SAM-dependent methyltransferase [Holophagales bacterium]
MDDLSKLASRTRDVYQRNAARFDAERSRILFERPWLDRFASLLSEKATILDVGCGAGEPIASYFLDLGLRVSGIDFSERMIELARQRFPAGRWSTVDMRQLELGTTFDGIVSWHAFFHLTPAEQRSTLPRFADHLRGGGALLLTVGPEESEISGTVGGEPVYHGSLSPAEYRRILAENRLEVVDFVLEDPTCDYATVLLARKLEESS